MASDDLVIAVEEDAEEPGHYQLSERGWQLARAYLERAGRFLPGWPPERRPHAPDR